MKLTKHQEEAVKANKGNYLVHAGSGSGKTSSFIARIAHLIKTEKVNPDSILGLTFTKEAANNMKDKLANTIGEDMADYVELSTFHSFANRIMRKRYPWFYKNKHIMKSWWRIRTAFDICGKDGLELAIKGGEFMSFISYQKSHMIREGMGIVEDNYCSEIETKEQLQQAYDLYLKQAREARLFEFDDMLIDFYYKLKEDNDLLEDIKQTYEYVMVDEFQDTNTANMLILKEICDDNLFAVGDFRQGIYGFINADVNNILNFTNQFNDVKLVELNENFRSTNQIVDFANNIISSSPVEKYKQFSPQIAARNVDGEKIRVDIYQDESTEVKEIFNRIESMIEDKGYKYNDFSILLRTNTQLGVFESYFAEQEVPVDVSSSKSFFDRKEIVDMLSYATHTINQEDDISINRIMNTPNRYISNKVVSNIASYAYDNELTFEEATREVDFGGRLNSNIRKVPRLFDELRLHVGEGSAGDFLEKIYTTTGYHKHIERTAPNEQDAMLKSESIRKLINMAKKFSDINAFLTHISIIRQNSGKNPDGVKLMTVHSSKGLEFPVVFIPSITSENYPHEMNRDVEEERRLFYVASTRAKDYMELSIPVFPDSSGGSYHPSPFMIDVFGDKLKETRKLVLHNGMDNTLYY